MTEQPVRRTQLKGCVVSTFWLGLDHRFGDKGDPLIFETMVFTDEFESVCCKRYETLKEAREGHEQVVDRYEDFRDDRQHSDEEDKILANNPILHALVEHAKNEPVSDDWERELDEL